VIRATPVSAVYLRQLDFSEAEVAIEAEVLQDGGTNCTSELCIVWTTETLEKLARLDFSEEELVGCEEAVEVAYWALEAEQCRLASARQRAGYVSATYSERPGSVERLGA
jgi:hypothetical protein